MSRAGRPSERAKHEAPKRNLTGPHELLDRIQAAGGVPDDVLDELRHATPSAATERASEHVGGLTERVVETGAQLGGKKVALGDDPARRMAWMLSVTNAMKESVPRKQWCRHLRAADPRVTEVRSVAVLSAGIWKCVECFRADGQAQLQANLWPRECDLCGAETDTFQGLTSNISACMVSLNVCGRCASFLQPADEPQ